jgi:L-ribulose-5-phosphate 3-epimerase
MKLAMNPWTVYGWELPETLGGSLIKALAKFGCQGFELVMDEGHNSSEKLIAQNSEIIAHLKDTGMGIPGVATALFWQYNLASQDESIRKHGIDVIRNGCKVAQSYGAPVFLAVAGLQEPGIDYCYTYETAVLSMRQAGKIAADHGVTIGVENVPCNFLMSPGEFRNFLNDVDHPNIKAYLDFGNGTMYGGAYPENWITAVRGCVALIHAKDFDPIYNEFVCCGQGGINWERVFSALKDIGYDGYLIVETPPRGGNGKPSLEAGLQAAQTSLSWLKKWVK